MIRRLDGQRVSNWTKVRLGLALLAVILLITPHGGHVDWIGAALMLGAGLMYAMHLAVSQRVLYEMPAPTVALYVLTAMTAVVCAAYVLHGPTAVPLAGLPPTMILAGITVLSRLLMFLGVKHLGSIQTALLGVTEILVTVVLSIFGRRPGRQISAFAPSHHQPAAYHLRVGHRISLPRRKRGTELAPKSVLKQPRDPVLRERPQRLAAISDSASTIG
jgi:drug/metabolite transporter (DMT)-like permease